MSTLKTFHLRVLDANETKIDTDARSLSARNRGGKFDILADHIPFITLLAACQITIRKADRDLEQIQVNRGLLKFVDNEAVILMDV